MPHCKCQCHTHKTPTQDNIRPDPTQGGGGKDLSENKLTFQINSSAINRLIELINYKKQDEKTTIYETEYNNLLKVLSGYNELRKINQEQFNTIVNQLETINKQITIINTLSKENFKLKKVYEKFKKHYLKY